MAIEFNCPHCNTLYRLPDDLAGKRANCKKQECRKVITIPTKTTIPPSTGSRPPTTGAPANGAAPPSRGRDDTPPSAPPVDIEAAAAAALNEAIEDDRGPSERTIPMTCTYCEHQWTEPLAKAGKNVLCPNPECRQRLKVPDLKKDDVKEDWRTGRSNKPSLAKENFEKLEGVQDAGEMKIVTQKSLKEADATGEEYEPVPLSRRLFFVALIGGPILLLIGFGIYAYMHWGVNRPQDRLMEDALKEYAATEDKPPPAEAALFSAIIHMAAAEYDLRQNDDKSLQPAIDKFKKVRSELIQSARNEDARRPAASERNALTCELALATLLLGGNDEQLENGTRIPWSPGMTVSKKWRGNQRTFTVHEELRDTLTQLRATDFDLKAALTRRLTRELVKHGPNGTRLASDIPVLLFNPPEQPEAKAIIALELLRADRNSEQARQMAEELKEQLAGKLDLSPFPASAQTLWAFLTPPIDRQLFSQPQVGRGSVSSDARQAYVGLWVLQGKPDDAMALAQQPGGTQAGTLRALVVYAEWAPDPGPALGAALAILKSAKPESLPQSAIFRLAQIAAASGKPDQAAALTNALTDDGLKTWAKADAFRLALKPDSKERADEAAVEVPDDPKKMRAAHAWARLWLARHNARVSGDSSKEKKAVALWPAGNIRPFGLAGIALGLQDR